MGFYLLSSSLVILLGFGYGLTVINATPAQSLERYTKALKIKTMKWTVNITGDQSILQTLCDAGTNDNFFITKENDEFILKSNEFEKQASHKDVNQIAHDYVETLNGILFLQYGIPVALKTGGLTRLNDKYGRDIFIMPETGRLELRGFEPTIIITKSNGETIVDRPGQQIIEKLIKAKSNEKAIKIFRLVQNGNWEYSDIYKIIEILLYEKREKLYDWVPKEKIRLLKHTANHYKAIGDKARHGIVSTDPPQKPMGIDEARAITKSLINKYVDEL